MAARFPLASGIERLGKYVKLCNIPSYYIYLDTDDSTFNTFITVIAQVTYHVKTHVINTLFDQSTLTLKV